MVSSRFMVSELEDKHTPPDPSAVMQRVIVLKHIFVKSLATPPPEYLTQCKERWSAAEWNEFLEGIRNQNAQQVERLRQSGLWSVMDQEERNFVAGGPAEVTQQALVGASWRVESLVCLLWSLGYVSELLPYDQQANPELTNQLPLESVEILIKKATLRPFELIEKQRDVAELWHWRSRNRQLQQSGYELKLPRDMTMEKIVQMASTRAVADGVIPTAIENDFPAFGKAYRDLTDQEYSQVTSIAQERHHALNWLCGFAPGNRWAETPTDT
jgi:hypothetical protein